MPQPSHTSFLYHPLSQSFSWKLDTQLTATTASSCFVIPAHQPEVFQQTSCQHQPHPCSYILLCHHFYTVIPSKYISVENTNKNIVPKYHDAPTQSLLVGAIAEHPAWPAAMLPTTLTLYESPNPRLRIRRMISLLTHHLPKLTPLLSRTELDSGSPGQCLPAE